MKGVEQSVASGNMGIENLKNPWVPNFEGIPAKMTDPAVGASTWASGNQIWIGTIGTLTVKEAIHRKIWRRSLNLIRIEEIDLELEQLTIQE